MPEISISTLVAALPELYQPVFGHPEHDADASRPCRDRLSVVASVAEALRGKLGRSLHILDLGCAQGYFALSLAAAGHDVTGVDRLPANIALCEALARQHPSFKARFLPETAEAFLQRVENGQYDIVLGLSVIHHLCHEHGLRAAVELLRHAAAKVEIILVETAQRSEPVYWAAAQPQNPRELFAAIPFAHAIAEHATHLSEVPRPLYFASAHWWWLGDELVRFDEWTSEQHELAENVHQGSRRYFFAPGRLAKYFDLGGVSLDRNRTELVREADFLRSPPAGLLHAPALYSYAIGEDTGWLVRELIPGRRLSALIDRHESFDRLRALQDILDEVCALEAAGLYHGNVRIWNVILGDDGRATLIDYGDITAVALDCAWPRNVFLSFLVFVRELLGEELPRIMPTRSPRFAPQHFPEPYRRWIGALWSQPTEQWTFARLRELLRAAVSGALTETSAGPGVLTPVAGTPWAAAVEQYLDELGAQQRRAIEIMDRELSQQRLRDDVLSGLLDDLAAARAERVNLQGAVESERAKLARESSAAAAQRAEHERFRQSTESATAALHAENERVRAELESARLTHAVLQTSSAALASRVELLLSETARLQTAIASCDQALDASKQECERGRIEAYNWWRATAQLTEELRIAYGTVSWRITAPLRWVKRIFLSGRQPPSQPSGTSRVGIRTVTRFVRSRPKLRSWLGARLDRYPSVKRRLKRMEMQANAGPSVVGQNPPGQDRVAGLEMGRVTRNLHARLQDALDRSRSRDAGRLP